MLDARTCPAGSIRYRSTSLCRLGVSGHHRAPSKVLVDGPLMPSGMLMVCPAPIETLPHHAHPSVGSLSGPAPLVLLNGYGCCPERISCAYTCPGSMLKLLPRSQLRSRAAAPAPYGVAPLVPPKICVAVSEALLADTELVGAWMSGLKRPSPVGPRLSLTTCASDATSKLPTPITRRALAGALTVPALGPLFPLAAITTAPASNAASAAVD